MSFIKKINYAFLPLMSAALLGCAGGGGYAVPNDIQAIFNKPVYKNATWGMYVVDMDTGKTFFSLKPHHQFFIGSIRKVFTLGQLLDEIGPTYRYNTPVYRKGNIDNSGVLNGDLILVASGDLTMGGRTKADGSVDYTGFDHNEANSIGNAILSTPDPLAGYIKLAQQVAQAGITKITGNVVIDDRLFQPFEFRGEFNVRPIFVNDDVVDVTINPTSVGSPASVVTRPISSALTITNSLLTGAADSTNTFALNPMPPIFLNCIGQPGCSAVVTGQLPINYVPAFTSNFPYVQTFRITQPSNYARTVFIEALENAGVTVDADTVANNPVQLLPAKNSYSSADKVAELEGLPFSENAKFVMKVSYNIGADTSLVLFGLTQGVDNMDAALSVEQNNLKDQYGILPNQYHFIDGSGGDDTKASNQAVVNFLLKMKQSAYYSSFLDSLPALGVDGSLGFVTDFKSDASLNGASGQVHAKTGTFFDTSSTAPILHQALGGYITTKQGRRLAFQLVVNNVGINAITDIAQVFQDQGRISAILWRDH